MKYFKQTFLLSSMILLLSACTNQNEKPKDLGNSLFKLLQTINTINEHDFTKKFISTDELKAIAEKNNKLDENAKNEMTSVPNNEWEMMINSQLNDLKSSNINWEKIKFKDFTYEIGEKSLTGKGLKGLDGLLTIEDNKLIHKIQAVYIFDGHRYRLVSINEEIN